MPLATQSSKLLIRCDDNSYGTPYQSGIGTQTAGLQCEYHYCQMIHHPA